MLGGGDVGREVLGVVGKVTGRLGGLVEGACKVATDIDFEELGRKIAEPFEDLFGIGGGAGSVGKAVPLGLGGMVVGLVVVVVG